MRWSAVMSVSLSALLFHVVLVAFEGPDRYSFVGGLATRMNDLAAALVARGHRVHHLFVGDPKLPFLEEREGGRLVLERWSQWISAYHLRDVYGGEEGSTSTSHVPCRRILRTSSSRPRRRAASARCCCSRTGRRPPPRSAPPPIYRRAGCSPRRSSGTRTTPTGSAASTSRCCAAPRRSRRSPATCGWSSRRSTSRPRSCRTVSPTA